MEEFTIKGHGDFINIAFEEVYGFPESTCHWGGYDVRSVLEIKSGNFKVKSILWTSTGEIFEFFQLLKKCNENLKGIAKYVSYERSFKLEAEYNDLGHVSIRGEFTEHSELNNFLKFEFKTDQSFIATTIKELEVITEKYGGMKGRKSNST